MTLFWVLLVKLLPLYAIMTLGFALGRAFPQTRAAIANVLIYGVAPGVFFAFTARVELQPAYLLLPVIYLILACVATILAWHAAKKMWPDDSKNLLGLAGGTINSGYFGVPVILVLFPERPDLLGIYMLLVLGNPFYEYTIGYYLLARGKFDRKAALAKLARLPVLYAGIAGLIFSACAIPFPAMLTDVARDFRGAYVVLGSLLIGLGLAGLTHWRVNSRMMGLAFGIKFIIWPIMMALVVALDTHILRLFSDEIHMLMMVFAIVPIGANIVAFAAQLQTRTDDAAMLVFASTLVALVYIPVFYIWLIAP